MELAAEAACCLRPNISDSLRKHICLRANTDNRGEGDAEAEASWRCLEASWKRRMCLRLFALQDNIPSLLKDESRERSATYFISLPPGSSTRSFSSSCFYTSQPVPTLRIFVAPRKRGIGSIDNFRMSVRYAACVRISCEILNDESRTLLCVWFPVV